MNNHKFHGQIIKINSNLILVVLENNQIITCKLKGVLKYKTNSITKPVVGDYVKGEFVNNEPIITTISERKNFLIRPSVSNIDIVIIVQSTNEPDFNFNLLMKFLGYYETFVSQVFIVITKMDLINNNEKVIFYKNILVKQNYRVFCLPNENELHTLKKCLAQKTFCLVGNSGVGKTTLINNIIPNLNLKTQPISKALNRGKHTTTTAQIIINDNYKLVDTPGFSSFDIKLISKTQLANSYQSFFAISCKCKYANCLHLNENGCAIKQAVDAKKIDQCFYDEYIKILKLLN